jgi:hypothetical protein
MPRRVAYLAVTAGVMFTLAGCAFSFFGYERRAEWRNPEERACMASGAVQVSAWIEPTSALNDRGACGIIKPLKVSAMGQGTVSIGPTAMLNCPMTNFVERWLGEAVQPAAFAWFGAPVVSIKQISAYSCRPRNNERGESLSEHSFGNALDVAAFTLADGRTITVKRDWGGADPNARGFLREVFAAGCQRFKTALGPGVKYHDDHFHFDLAHHNKTGTSRYCRPRLDMAPPRPPADPWLMSQGRGGVDFGMTGSVSSYAGDELGELLSEMPPSVAASLDDPFGVSELRGAGALD